VPSVSPSDLLQWCLTERAWQRAIVEMLVTHESPSYDKAAVDRCGAALSGELTALGATVTRIDGGVRGDHLRADVDGSGGRVLLLGHFDTVWPIGQLSRMPLREDAGRLYGPGVFDMKAGIAVALLAVRALNAHRSLARPHITMLWTTDEEIGSGTSRDTIEKVATESDAVLVLEPSLPGGGVKTSRKGVGEVELIVHGVSAHAGLDPEKGASAIHELAQQIVALESLQDPGRGVTLNVGQISGGTRTNVIADTARAMIDVRVPTMADAATVEQKLRSLTATRSGTRLEVNGSIDRPPLERTSAVVRLYECARDVAHDLGQDLQEGPAGGGSDGNFTAALGVPTLDGLGPRGSGAHAVHEHVELEDLPWRAAFLAMLLRRVGGLQ
jgi:glutamate carboxypeptidase